MSPENPHALHMGIAEQGKVLALQGNHKEALRHYREAMKLAVSHGAPEIFFRHHMLCAIESLERMGAHDEVLAYCTRVREHYEAHPPPNEMARKDRASAIEREGVVLFRAGRREEALLRFKEAIASAAPMKMPLSESLARWLVTGFHITPERLSGELDRHGYWSVCAGTVQKERALALPAMPLP